MTILIKAKDMEGQLFKEILTFLELDYRDASLITLLK